MASALNAFLFLVLLPTVLGFLFANLFLTPRPEKVDEHLTSSFIPAAAQIITHIIINLNYEATIARNSTPVVVIERQEGDKFVVLDIIEKDSKSEEPDMKLVKRKLKLILSVLNKEAQIQYLDTYQGMSKPAMMELAATTYLTVRDQLLFALGKVAESNITESAQKVIKEFIWELQDPNSDLSIAMNGMPPVIYA